MNPESNFLFYLYISTISTRVTRECPFYRLSTVSKIYVQTHLNSLTRKAIRNNFFVLPYFGYTELYRGGYSMRWTFPTKSTEAKAENSFEYGLEMSSCIRPFARMSI